MFETDILVFIVLSWFKHQSKPSNVSFANCENTVSSEHELKDEPDETEEYREADNFDKFDKLIFRNFWHQNDARAYRRWGRSVILEEIGLQYFSHTQGA